MGTRTHKLEALRSSIVTVLTRGLNNGALTQFIKHSHDASSSPHLKDAGEVLIYPRQCVVLDDMLPTGDHNQVNFSFMSEPL